MGQIEHVVRTPIVAVGLAIFVVAVLLLSLLVVVVAVAVVVLIAQLAETEEQGNHSYSGTSLSCRKGEEVLSSTTRGDATKNSIEYASRWFSKSG